jgi:uncharacterized protein YgiM (DUF1202 family)
MDHLFSNFDSKKSSLPTASTSTSTSTSNKRHASPAPATAPITAPAATTTEETPSAKKLKRDNTSSNQTAAPVKVTDDLEIEAKREVTGSAGLGGGETEGLILSHAVRSSRPKFKKVFF